MSFGHDIAALVAEFERGLLAKHPLWPRVKLSEVAELLNGFPYESAKFSDAGGMPLLRIRDILPGRTETRYEGNLDDPRMFKVRNGDLVVGMDGDFNSRIWEGGEVLLNQRVCLIRAREEIYSQRFLAYLLPGYLKLINGHTSSVTVKHLSSRTLQDTPLPFPPLAQQRRIVARIDALFAEIGEGEAALAEARKGLDIFRRALLKAAVTGELTRDWRAANPASETGHDLLARIAEKRITKGTKKRRSRHEADAAPLDTAAMPELPETWAWASLNQVKIGDQRNGISIAGSSSPPGVKAMRLDALTAEGLNLEAVRYIPLQKDRVADYLVNAGDLLVSRANGSPEFVGRAVFVEDIKESVVFPDTVIRYPLGARHLTGRWIELAWSSPLGRSQIRRLAKTTAGILKISQEDIAQIVLPIPPPTETAEILLRVSGALSACADTLAALDAEVADAARLKQSILKAAFEGRLVPQDAADEPASTLLARFAVDRSEVRAKRGRAKSGSAIGLESS